MLVKVASSDKVVYMYYNKITWHVHEAIYTVSQGDNNNP